MSLNWGSIEPQSDADKALFANWTWYDWVILIALGALIGFAYLTWMEIFH